MKQLKFMLAAATAIGLAAAAQADLQKTLLDNGSQDFEGFTDQTTFAELEADGFSYPAADGDNESAVAAKESSDPSSVGNWVLDVNTGTNPVLRALSPVSGSGVARDVEVESKKKVYIDAMVQFTVTPVGDVVTASAEDKLMIYLAESTNDVDKTRTFTNLVVKAGKAILDPFSMEVTDVEAADVVVSAEGLTVEANTWYNLKVEVTKNDTLKLPLFTIKIGDKQLATQSDLNIGDQTRTLFPSLMGLYNEQNNPNAMILKSVGFAGEGKVDNLAFYKDVEQQTSVDFTLALGDGVSAVTWTVDGDDMQALTSDLTSYTAKNVAGKAIAITGVEYAAGYAGAEDWANWSIAANVLTESTNVVVAATKLGDVDANGVVTPTPDTIAKAAGGAFACPEATDAGYAEAVAKLGKAVKWASTVANKKSYADAMAYINAMVFGDEVTTNNVPEAAYLLNCEPTAEEVKKAFADFSFSSADLAALIAFEADTDTDAPVFALEGKEYNGKLTIKGAKSLGAWFDVEDGKIASGVDGAKEVPNFLKAVLTK